jgi:hypothetical protein
MPILVSRKLEEQKTHFLSFLTWLSEFRVRFGSVAPGSVYEAENRQQAGGKGRRKGGREGPLFLEAALITKWAKAH